MITILDRRRCSVLSLVLTRKWYDMIAKGEKREEYRLATEYWQKRLWHWNLAFTPTTAPVVEFRLGYAKDAPRMAFWTMGLETAGGMMPYAFVAAGETGKVRHPEWGEPENAHFVIELGGPVEIMEGGAVVGCDFGSGESSTVEFTIDRTRNKIIGIHKKEGK